MRGLEQIDRICDVYQNEQAHTEHVTRTALQLFDALAQPLKLKGRDLLEAAGRLHDIGFSSRPEQHEERSCEVLLQEGLTDYSKTEEQQIAAMILLHGGRWREYREHELIRSCPDLEQVRRLAALLRMADGVDHGHIQDTVINGVEVDEQTIHLTVKSSWYRGNGPWIEKKADMAEDVFDRSVAVTDKGGKKQSTSVFRGVVSRKQSTGAAARRVLYSQYRLFADAAKGLAESDDPGHIHDMRVCARRFRAALRLFKKWLPHKTASSLSSQLKQAGDRLSAARDLDVWLIFLQRQDVKKTLDKNVLRVYTASLTERRKTLYGDVRTWAAGEDVQALLKTMKFFVRAELLALEHADTPLFAEYSAGKLRRIFKRLMKQERPAKSSAEDMHDLRKYCRRERYYAEFAAPAVGSDMQQLARRLRDVVSSLGGFHDMDVYLEILQHDKEAPRQLVPVIKAERKKYWKEFKSSWKALHNKAFRLQVVSRMAAVRDM